MNQEKILDLAAEARRYADPIPSRQFIAKLLTTAQKPMSRRELQEALALTEPHHIEALRRRLRAMERDGALVFTRRKRYVIPEKLDMLKGKVIGHEAGYAFLQVPGRKQDLFLPPEACQGCLDGDIILAQPLGEVDQGRETARVIRILTPRSTHIVGRYFNDKGLGFVVPYDLKLNFDILVPPSETASAVVGDIVLIELRQRPKGRLNAVGRIIEVLGDPTTPGIPIEIAVREYDIPHVWPKSVLHELPARGEQLAKGAIERRIDLRDRAFVTIDGEDAQDFDDAVYAEAIDSVGWRLWVAIADVAHYVQPGTLLDKEACTRGTSVYFPTTVIPMLPEVLSNDLCSIKPDSDRLTVVCEMVIGFQGNLLEYRFYEATIRSHARLTYNAVYGALFTGQISPEALPLLPQLTTLHTLYEALREAQLKRGTLELDTQEFTFIYNEAQRIERIEPLVRNTAHKLIESCMIVANHAAAQFIEKNKLEAPYRIHEPPSDTAFQLLRTQLAELGLNLSQTHEITPKCYQTLLKETQLRKDHPLIQLLLLRSLKQAIYFPENKGHFGLSLESYTHFTSPIRRYSDLLVHRAIKEKLAEKQKSHREQAPPLTPLSESELLEAQAFFYQQAEQCSLTERRADEATRDAHDFLKCAYLQSYIGKKFDGIISGVTAFGLFVRLNDLGISGLVHIAQMENEYYHFDPKKQLLVGEHSKKRYQLGNPVTIRIHSVDTDQRKINLVLAPIKPSRASDPKSRSPKKPRRKKNKTL